MTTVPQQRILVIGKVGQIGWSLQRTLTPLGAIVARDHIELDLANPDLIVKAVREVRPTLIVNAGAYTAVDKAESEKDLAMAINGTGPGILAEEAKKLGAGIVHYSTDYVFDGTKGSPYSEEDSPSPLNTYGKTKLAGDQAVQDSGAPYLIFRTSWVYGMRGQNFLRTILHLFQEREEIRIVDDQFGAPTWSRLISETTAQVLAQIFSPQTKGSLKDFSGVYNLSCSGKTSWYGFTAAIAEFVARNHLAPKVSRIAPIPSSDYPTPAKRPAYGVLSHDKLQKTFGLTMPSWENQMALCLDPQQ